MDGVYVDSAMLQQLNATVQKYLVDILTHYNLVHEDELRSGAEKIVWIGENKSISIIVSGLTLTLGYLIYKMVFGSARKLPPISFEIEVPEAGQKHWKGKRLYESGVVDPEQPGMIQCQCPATGQYLGSYRSMNRDDVDELVYKASQAQESWKKTTFAQRIQVLLTLKEFIMANQEAVARIACRDSGKTMTDASMGEILVTIERLEWIVRYGKTALKPTPCPGPTNFFLKLYKGGEIRYSPLGVVAAIVSWNYSLHNLIGPVAAAIFTGNGVVLKCSEQVVWSSIFFMDIIKKALVVCGHDPDLVQLCYCFPPTESDDTANYFVSHPGIKQLTFIGSKPVAHHVLTNAAKSLTPVVVELGGKDALIVLDEVKSLQSLSSIILRGTFQATGQNCIGVERVVVTTKNYDSLIKILHERIAELKLGSDIDSLEEVDVGAMISSNRFGSIEELIQDAVSQGARLLHGGSRYTHPNYPQGNYFQPTLLVDVTPDMKIATQEVFGPVLVVMKAQDIHDAIRIANSTPYGLGGAVFGDDLKACNYVADHIKTGNVAINDFASYYVSQMPFGGVGDSGFGKFCGIEGLRGLCLAKSVSYDKYPFYHTKLPKLLDYPAKDKAKTWKFSAAFVVGAYTYSPWRRLKAIIALAQAQR